MYHIEHDYEMARTIHEQRLREAEVDRLAATIRAAQKAVRGAASSVGVVVSLRVKRASRRAA